jgi:CHAT domain-containing protein/tetratricopeptide (TPR) repeat protein
VRNQTNHLVERLIQATDWRVAQRLMLDHRRQLLSDDAERRLAQQVVDARARQDTRRMVVCSSHLAWLRRCRQLGLPSPDDGVATDADLMLCIQRALVASVDYRDRKAGVQLEQVLSAWRRVFDAPAFDEANEVLRASVSAQFVEAVVARSAADHDLAEIAESGRTCRQFADGCFPLSPARRNALDAVRRCHQEYFAATRDKAAADTAIATATLLLFEAQPGEPGLSRYKYNLGYTLIDRYQTFQDPNDLDQAVGLYEDIVSSDPRTAIVGEQETYISALAAALRERYLQYGSDDDIARATELLEELVKRTHSDPGALLELGLAQTARYDRTGRPDAWNKAHVCFAAAAQFSAPGTDDHLEALNDLGAVLTSRYQHGAAPADLDRAIEAHEEAIAQGEKGSPHLIRNMANLSRALVERYRRDGFVDDSIRAIELAELAIAEWPERQGPPEHGAILAGALFHRYLRSGDVADLNRVITILKDTINGLPSNSRELGRLESYIGFALDQRFHDLGALDDLNEAVEHHRAAVLASPRGSPDWAERVTGLASSLRARADHLGEPGELTQVIELLEDAASCLPEDGPALPRVLNSLGAAHFSRFEFNQDREGALQAADCYERAARLTNGSEPVILTNLAAALAASAAADAESRAVAAATRAIELSAPDSPELPLRLLNLGQALANRFVTTGQPDDRTAATSAFRRACSSGLRTNTQSAFDAGRRWGDWSAHEQDWATAREAYSTATTAAEDLFARQAARQHREFSVGQTSQVFSKLSYAMARTGAIEEAATALEHGRARLLAEAFNRSPPELDRLHELGHLELLDRFEAAARRLDSLERREFRSLEAEASLRDPSGARTAALREARAQFRAVTEAIRAIPGLGAFLAAPSFADLASVAGTSPIVYVSASPPSGHAILVRNRTTTHIALDDLSLGTLRRRWQVYAEAYAARGTDLQAWRRCVSETARWLWDAVMGPVLNALAGEAHARLVPCGLLGALPLHAAWTPDETTPSRRRYAIDEILLTYAPSALALDELAHAATTGDGRDLLVVDDPRRPDLPLLNYAADEVASVTARFAHHQVLARTARKQEVLASLHSADIVHVVCHGYADVLAPLNSALMLAAERLQLRDIMSMGPLRARLVVLSACETATTGVGLPDESIGFPTGLLRAGARGVIGSMWAVPDSSAMMVMARFYQYWQNDSMRPEQALRAAQLWLRDSTNGEKQAALPESMLTTPATAAAARLWLTARETVHPIHWAGFTYHGLSAG